MKKLVLLATVMVLFVFASCGGGGGGTPTPPATPTSNETKAASDAVMSATTEAAIATAASALQGGGMGAMVIKSDTGKEYISHNFTYTYICPISGVVDTSGSVSGNCSGTDSTWSCPSLTISIPTMQFNDCAGTVTQDSMDYTVTLNGTGSATLSGSVSGSGESITALSFNGPATANTTVSGDIVGTAVMNITVNGSGVPDPDPDITCSGTVDFTSDSTTEVCTVKEDCSGCVL